MALLEAKVKSVLSGDTVILHNINNPKQERTLSLAFVSAPRLRREGDEVRNIPDKLGGLWRLGAGEGVALGFPLPACFMPCGWPLVEAETWPQAPRSLLAEMAADDQIISNSLSNRATSYAACSWAR